ncbi:hypothetical protein LPJ57_003003, partial [Coemansia sp. RSA 486]
MDSSMTSMPDTIAKYSTNQSEKGTMDSRARLNEIEDQPKQLLSGAKLAIAIISLDIL